MLSGHWQFQRICLLPVISLYIERTMNYDQKEVQSGSIHMECKVMLDDARVHSNKVTSSTDF